MNSVPPNTAPTIAPACTKSALWPSMIFILLGFNVVVVGITVFAALHFKAPIVDRTFDVSALHWDQVKAQREHQAQVGWTCVVRVDQEGGSSVVHAQLRNAEGTAIHGADVQAVCFHNAHASEPTSLTLAPTGDGYAAGAATLTPGLWTIRITAQARGEKALFSTELDPSQAHVTAPTAQGEPAP